MYRVTEAYISDVENNSLLGLVLFLRSMLDLFCKGLMTMMMIKMIVRMTRINCVVEENLAP